MSESSDERTSVRTYLPACQKEAWKDHADQLDMALSEFVRSMVQAGRRGFEGDDVQPGAGADGEPPLRGSNPGGDGLETAVLDELRGGPLGFDELVEAVTGDPELDVDAVLDDLEDRDLVAYDRIEGTFRVTDGE